MSSHLFDRVPPPIVDSGVPIALGIVPIVFSALLFLVPIGRALVRPLRRRRDVEERGRLAVLRAVLERVRAKQPVTDRRRGRRVARRDRSAGRAASVSTASSSRSAETSTSSKSGETRWRFADLETEAAAVAAEREAAADDEARLGKVVYATDER